jgi:hypothetical protein
MQNRNFAVNSRYELTKVALGEAEADLAVVTEASSSFMTVR